MKILISSTIYSDYHRTFNFLEKILNSVFFWMIIIFLLATGLSYIAMTKQHNDELKLKNCDITCAPYAVKICKSDKVLCDSVKWIPISK